MKIFNWFGKKNVEVPIDTEPEKCEHTYYVVKICEWVDGEVYFIGKNCMIRWKISTNLKSNNKEDVDHRNVNPTIRVCIKCGKCVDEISVAMDYIEKEWEDIEEQEQNQRLAEKMYADGCCDK